MTSRVANRLIQSLRVRRYSSQAAAATIQTSEKNAADKIRPQVKKLKNGLTLACSDSVSPVSSLAVYIRAGTSSEDVSNLGITHCLRHTANLSTQNLHRMSVVRGIERAGAGLSVTSTRDFMIYSVECTRDNPEVPLTILREVTTPHEVKFWEVDGLKQRMLSDISESAGDPGFQAFELLHAACMSNGYDRSLFCPVDKVGKFKPKQIVDFMKANYQPDRMLMVGAGVDMSVLEDVGNEYDFSLKSDNPPSIKKAGFVGGQERRLEAQSDLTFAVLAAEGPSLSDKDMIAAGVFQHVMGTGPYVKYSNNDTISRLGKAAAKASSSPCAISAFMSQYIDTGLFGFSVMGSPSEMNSLLKAAVGEYTKVTKEGLTDAEVARGKAQLKANIAMNLECSNSIMQNLAEQAMSGGSLMDFSSMMSAVDNITTADVTKYAKKVSSSKFSMSAYGDLSNTPHVTELS